MLDKNYDYKASEKKWQEFWEKEGIYRFDPESTAEIFSIDTPPPTVSGSLHIGHIFSYTQAEMIARFRRMQGKNVFYPFGFDDNGLPTERLVEREQGIFAGSLPRSEFIDACMKTTCKYEKEFKELWQSLGFSVDWDLQYETISPLARRISQRSFLHLAKEGKAYQKDTPVLWCTTCRTSIAQAELEWKDRETTFNWIPFDAEGTEVWVATTRPELLYGCVALFVHPADERYAGLIGKEAAVPLYGFKIPILGDERVSREKGTGAVMCATFGDTTDLEWYRIHNLPYKKVIGPDGIIDSGVPLIQGLSVREARERILQALSEKGFLKKSEKIMHTVAIHERCGKDIEIIPSRQWFIDILSHKEEFLQAADRINWYPAYMKDRYLRWVENLKWDWCISRQRYFGVPFPVWYCSQCGRAFLAKEESLPVNPLETMPGEPCTCGSESFVPEGAVLDTWATSSLTPFINTRWKEAGELTGRILPMSMRTQAHEIIRTWAFYSIVRSLYIHGEVPWKEIMVCGFVMAGKEKISKSKNNSSFSPEVLIGKYSADGLRYWAANAKLGTDIAFAEEELKASGRFLTKLWNAAKFTLMHLSDFNRGAQPALMPADRWILEKYGAVAKRAKELLEQYEIGAARYEIDGFFWKGFCDNYLEIIKDRLYKPENHGEENRASAQYALYHSFMGLLKLYAIYVPHITEEIYRAYFASFEKIPSIHRHLWDLREDTDQRILAFGEALERILAEVRRYKSEGNLSLKEPLERIEICAGSALVPMLEQTLKDLCACTAATEIVIREGDELLVKIK